LRFACLCFAAAASGGDALWRRALAPASRTVYGYAILAAQRLLASGVVVEYRQLWPLEGATLLCAPLLCACARFRMRRRHARQLPRLERDDGNSKRRFYVEAQNAWR